MSRVRQGGSEAVWPARARRGEALPESHRAGPGPPGGAARGGGRGPAPAGGGLPATPGRPAGDCDRPDGLTLTGGPARGSATRRGVARHHPAPPAPPLRPRRTRPGTSRSRSCSRPWRPLRPAEQRRQLRAVAEGQGRLRANLREGQQPSPLHRRAGRGPPPHSLAPGRPPPGDGEGTAAAAGRRGERARRRPPCRAPESARPRCAGTPRPLRPGRGGRCRLAVTSATTPQTFFPA